MTQQIGRAILIATCATIIVAGLAAYFAVRYAMIDQLDQLVIERAALVLRDTGMSQDDPSRRVPQGDRYLIRTDTDRTIARTPPDRAAPVLPVVISRAFADTADGGRVRTLTLRWAPPRPARPVTIVYSTPAAAYQSALRALAASLGAVAVAGIGITAIVARRVARRATRPLAATAEAIGSIDERNLARRIDIAALPPELLPVAQRLNEMLMRIEGAFGRQRQFVIDAAHELRTPVAAMRTTVEVALDGRRDQPALSRALERCLNNARLLERITAQLTDSLRNDQAVREQAVNVARLVIDCVGAIEPLAKARGQELVAHVIEGAPILADVDKLNSITINLLSNAIECTPAGGRIDVEAATSDQREWRLIVRDTGVGIESEHLERVFDPFFRVDRARNRERGHLGLGLYMVKTYAESMGGSVKVTSEIGRGTEVVVCIPIRAAQEYTAPQLPLPPSGDETTEHSPVSCLVQDRKL